MLVLDSVLLFVMKIQFQPDTIGVVHEQLADVRIWNHSLLVGLGKRVEPSFAAYKIIGQQGDMVDRSRGGVCELIHTDKVNQRLLSGIEPRSRKCEGWACAVP